MNKKSKIFLIILLLLFILPYIIVGPLKKGFTRHVLKNVPKEATTLSMEVFNHILNQNTQSLYNTFCHEAKDSITIEDLNNILEQTSFLADYESIKLLGYHYSLNNQGNLSTITYEVKSGEHWLWYVPVFKKIDDQYELFRFDLHGKSGPYQEPSTLGIFHEGPIGIFLLVMVVLNTAFTLVSSALCFGSNIKHRKLWTFLILTGLCAFSYNWASSQFNFSLLSIGFPVSTLSSEAKVVVFRLPVFAIIYWLKVRRNNTECGADNIGAIEENQTHIND